MVILGGLELVAAGYLLREHNKNKRDRRELRQEAESLEDVEYEIEAEERRRRRHDHHHRHDSRERRHHHHHSNGNNYNEPKPQYNPNVTYGAQQGPPPPRPSSVPPMMQQPGGNNYPPTGWPAQWNQSHRPGPEHKFPPPPPPPPQQQQQGPPGQGQYLNPNYQYPQYGQQRAVSPSQYPPEKSAAAMPGRRPSPYGPSASTPSPHVRFDDAASTSSRYDPPPAYEA